MHDFLGRPYHVGEFVACGGAGNTKAEYGMILLKVVEVGDKLKLVRLRVRYVKHTMESAEVDSYTVTAKNPNKYVMVLPRDDVIDLFNRAVEGKLKGNEPQTIGKWLHGQNQGLFG